MREELTNLLQETIDAIQRSGKQTFHVEFVHVNNGYFTWFDFESVAKNINYDNGYGGQ